MISRIGVDLASARTLGREKISLRISVVVKLFAKAFDRSFVS